MCNRYYVIGTTCAGKDYMMEMAKEAFPSLVGLVQVGKEFRKRYPPEHFQGMGAPSHTENEAVEIFEEQLADQESKGYKHIFIAGQPRRASQVELTVMQYPGKVLWVYAEDEILKQRADQRDESSRQLSLDRMVNDKVQMFDVLYLLLREEIEIVPIHTTEVEQWIHRLIFEKV